jgi:hypothetical protein
MPLKSEFLPTLRQQLTADYPYNSQSQSPANSTTYFEVNDIGVSGEKQHRTQTLMNRRVGVSLGE